MKTLTNILGMKKVARGMGLSLASIILAGSLFSGGCNKDDDKNEPTAPNPTQTTQTTGTSDIITSQPAGTSDTYSGETGTSDILAPENTPDIYIPANNLPEISSSPLTEIEECKNYSSQIIATDKDNDFLDYTLTQKPEGMTADSTGLINWNVPCGISSDITYPVSAEVSDGKDSTTQSWNILVKKIIVPNQAPTTTITRDFGDGLDGKVDYTTTTTDLDDGGYAGTLDFILNGNQHFVGSNPTGINPAIVKFSVPIIAGTNDFQASSIDNLGLRNGTSDSTFYSPTEAEARAKIEEILEARLAKGEFQNYIKDYTGTLNCSEVLRNINVDYAIIGNDGKGRLINYISNTDNTINDLGDKSHMDSCNPKKPNLYMRLLPKEEMESRTNTFFDNEF
jgi:hypothetical protein